MMESENNEGKSIIKGSGFLNVDWGDIENGSILFFDGVNILLGIDEIPYMLYTTISFDINIIPDNFLKDLYEVRKLHLTVSLSFRSRNASTHYAIPRWLENYNKLEFLSLNYFDLNGLKLIKYFPVEELIIRNAYIQNVENTIIDLMSLPNLKTFIYDESCAELSSELSKVSQGKITFKYIEK